MAQNTQNNPFADAIKAFTDNISAFTTQKTPAFDVNSLVSAQRRSAEAFTAASEVFTQGLQAITRRQAEILQDNTSALLQFARDVATSSSPETAAAKHAAFTQGAVGSAISNTRELAQMVSKSGIEVFDVIAENINEATTTTSKKKAA